MGKNRNVSKESLRENAMRYGLLTEDIRDVVWTADLNGNLTYVSPSVMAQTGYTPEEYYEMSIDERMPAESVARALAEIRNQLALPPEKRAESAIYELQVLTKTGQVLDVEINTSWMHDSDGIAIGLVGITRDITQRKRAQRALKESEERYRELVSFASEGIMVHGNGVILDSNQAFANMVGFSTPEALIGKNGLEVIPFTPESRQALVAHVTSDSEESHDVEIIRPDGTHAYMATRGRSTILRGNPVRIVSMLDVTDRYEAEQALRDKEAIFRAVGGSATEALVLVNGDGLVEYWNPAASRMFGYSAAEMRGAEVHEKVMPKEFEARFRRAFEKFRETGSGEAVGRIIELTARKKDGTEFPVEISVNPLQVKGKYWASAIVRDITDRKLAEEEKALNAMRLSALLELNQMTGASLHDLTRFALEEAVRLTQSTIGYIAFASEDETVLTMHAWSSAAMAECAIEDKPLVYPVESTGLWGEAVRQRHPIITNNYAAENPLKRGIPAGHVRITRHMNVPVFDGNRIVIVAGVGNKPENYDESDVRQLTLLMEGMWRIVAHRRTEEESAHLQEQLSQASKMEAIGRLAGGVAHDFNNLLTTILGYSEMIRSKMAEDDPARVDIDEIRKAGERAASLTQQLLAFSRKQVIKPRIIDLNAVVIETRKMLERLIGENIKLVFRFAPDLGRINVDPHQIDQVLLNLAVNARDAMPSGGTLTIATTNLTIGKDKTNTYSDVAPGPYAALSVADTGVGMDAETKARLFEPFFSTKEKGKGTGLGLAMVYGIARQNGGTISVQSEPGSGTIFQICFPRFNNPPTVRAESRAALSPTGNETILVVEDNDMVRRLALQILSRLGYEVLEATGANDAIRICEKHPKPIHLLLSDVVMPDMNGAELYVRLQSIRKQLRVLFMSGYAEDVLARHGVLSEDTEFLQKPFTMESLATRVRHSLDN